jgi:UDP-N-acetylmuramoylalanine--D-glutamate ligase
VLAQARKGRARQLAFRPSGTLTSDGAYFAGDEARLRQDGQEEVLFRKSEVKLPGAHLGIDLLAAAAAARLMGAPLEAIRRAVRAFSGVEHVLERVAELRGVAFFNDSKATNVDAAQKSLEAFTGPVLVILGGRYKGGDFADLAPALRAHGKAVFAIGEAQERIATALSGVVPVIPCGSLRQAVERAFQGAVAGDTVLLAPACSSFDMFTDYAERGRAFKDEVRRLQASLHG